jgi:hypothetical protein
MVRDPSGFFARPSVVLPMEKRSISLATNSIESSYIAMFHMPATGGAPTAALAAWGKSAEPAGPGVHECERDDSGK